MMRKLFIYLTVLMGVFMLVPGTGSVWGNEPGFWNLSTIVYPGYKEKVPFEPVDLIVQLEQGAKPETFRAELNGKDITDNFAYDESQNQLVGTVGPEDGLRIQEDGTGRWDKLDGYNLLKTTIKGSVWHWKGWEKHNGHKVDVDLRVFFVKGRGLTRETTYGSVRGLEIAENAWAWLGVPYAKPPMGDLRWRAPQEPAPWAGILDATAMCSMCVQPLYDRTWHTANVIVGSEDCLYLNIYRPKSDAKNLPVYLYIHGGANNFGSNQGYDGAPLALRGNMIVIFINYRVNAIGWLTHPCFRDTEGTLDASGNYGTLDAIKAVEWVKNNIQAFGGNPSNITVGGQSAGAHNTLNLIMSPLAAGLFQKAALQSAAMTLLPLATGDTRTNKTIEWLLVDDGTAANPTEAAAIRASMTLDQIEAYLRGKSADKVMTAEIKGPGAGSSPYHDSFRDGYVIPDATWLEIIAAGAYNKVPMMIGNTEYEWKAFMPLYGPAVKAYFKLPSGPYTWHNLYDVLAGSLTLDAVLPTPRDKGLYETAGLLRSRSWKLGYCDTIARAFKANDPNNAIYTYLFKWAGGTDPATDNFDFIIGSGHAFDIPFFQGGDQDVFHLNSFTEANRPGREALQGVMMDYLAQFVATGNPNPPSGLPEWPQWSNTVGEPKGVSFDADLDNALLDVYTTEITPASLKAEILAAYATYTSPYERGVFALFGLTP